MERLRTSELAQAGGVNLQTLRYYEREGLLPRPPRTAGGYRAFPREAVDLIRFIKRAQGLGFTLREIKELIVLRDHPQTACDEVRRQAEAKVAEITQRIRLLQGMKRELTQFARACAGRARPHACPLLEALDKTGDENHDQPERRESERGKARTMELDRGRVRGSRGVDLLRRPAGAAGLGRRERMGQPAVSP